MASDVYTERDWKLFRNRIADWQEAYMGRLIEGYIELLSEDGNPSERFWELDKRIRQDRKASGVSVTMARSKLVGNLVALRLEGAISESDLEGFSDPLREAVERVVGIYEEL